MTTINYHLLSDIEPAIGRHGLFESDLESYLHIVERLFTNDAALFDDSLSSRLTAAWTNWESTLNL